VRINRSQHFIVFGAGAVGGYLAARWTRSGHRVSALVRRPFLDAEGNNKNSITVSENGVEIAYALYGVLPYLSELSAWEASLQEYFESHDPPDWIVCTMKAHMLPNIAWHLERLLRRFDVPVLTVVNGIPWWYRSVGNTSPLRSVDPHGHLYRIIGLDRAIGAVTTLASHLVSPGHIKVHSEGSFVLAEARGGNSERLSALVETLRSPDTEVLETEDLSEHVWFKLLGNAAINPMSVLLEIPQGYIASNPALNGLLMTLLQEVAAVAKSAGVKKKFDLAQRIRIAESVGGHLTSTHQDYLKGNTLELDPILGAVIELGEMYSIPTPQLKTLYTLVSEKSAWSLKVRDPAEKNKTIQ